MRALPKHKAGQVAWPGHRTRRWAGRNPQGRPPSPRRTGPPAACWR